MCFNLFGGHLRGRDPKRLHRQWSRKGGGICIELFSKGGKVADVHGQKEVSSPQNERKPLILGEEGQAEPF